MDIYSILKVCVLFSLTDEGICRKTKHKGNYKSDQNDDVTKESINSLRKTKFPDQRKLYVNDVTDYACLSKNADRLVYRYENKTHIYVGFDNLPDQTLTEMTWRKKDPKSGQEVLFKENMDSCHTSVTQRFCLIQVFADMANKLKTVKFHEKCLKLHKA